MNSRCSFPIANHWRRCARLLLLLQLAALACGCSSFNHAWKTAGIEPVDTNSLAGRWQGTWLSDVNGHTEQLRCLVTRQSETNYSARFQAKYRKGVRFTFSYTALLSAEERNRVFHFQGEARLPWWAGGRYQYEGHSNTTNFFSTYECKYDRGTFQMVRPPAGQ